MIPVSTFHVPQEGSPALISVALHGVSGSATEFFAVGELTKHAKKSGRDQPKHGNLRVTPPKNVKKT